MQTELVIYRFYFYYRIICKFKGVVQTFHLICMIELKSELMLKTVALHKLLAIGHINLYTSQEMTLEEVASLSFTSLVNSRRCSPNVRFGTFVWWVWQLIGRKVIVLFQR